MSRQRKLYIIVGLSLSRVMFGAVLYLEYATQLNTNSLPPTTTDANEKTYMPMKVPVIRSWDSMTLVILPLRKVWNVPPTKH